MSKQRKTIKEILKFIQKEMKEIEKKHNNNNLFLSSKWILNIQLRGEYYSLMRLYVKIKRMEMKK